MSMIRMALCVGAVALAAAGCAGGESGSAGAPTTVNGPATTTSAANTPSGGGTTTGASVAVPEQLRFTATTLDGASFDGASLGGRPVVLWFWAPWCPDCNAEAPGLREVAQTHGDVTFVGVAALDQVPAMQEFVRKHSLGSFVHLADTDGALWRRFGVTHQPAYAFVTPAGEVKVEKHQLDKDELARRVAGLSGS